MDFPFFQKPNLAKSNHNRSYSASPTTRAKHKTHQFRADFPFADKPATTTQVKLQARETDRIKRSNHINLSTNSQRTIAELPSPFPRSHQAIIDAATSVNPEKPKPSGSLPIGSTYFGAINANINSSNIGSNANINSSNISAINTTIGGSKTNKQTECT